MASSSYSDNPTSYRGGGGGGTPRSSGWNHDDDHSNTDGNDDDDDPNNNRNHHNNLGMIVEENNIYNDVPLDTNSDRGISTTTTTTSMASMASSSYRDDDAGGVSSSLPHVEELKSSNRQYGSGTRSAGGGVVSWLQRGSSRRKRYVIGTVFGVVVILVLIIVVSTTSNKSKSSSNSGNGTFQIGGGNGNSNNSGNNGGNSGITFANRNSTKEEVLQFVKNQILYRDSDWTHIINTIKTPQHRAAAWLSRDDHANLKVPVIPSKTTSTSLTDESNNEIAIYRYLVRYIMAVNYFSYDGPNTWKNKLNFLSKNTVCDWQSKIIYGTGYETTGVFCDTTTKRVPNQLLLYSNQLKGTIPSENGYLTTLTHLDVSTNTITGTIPTELCQLTLLKKLDLSINQIQGGIPPCFGTSLSNVQSLYIHNNQLEGTIPTQMARMTQLQRFIMEENQFTGNPITIWNNMTQLHVLYANRNNFTGYINDAFVPRHKALTVVDVSHNQFTYDPTSGNKSAVFPHHLLTLQNLTHLDLSNNPLHGSFPKVLFPVSSKNHKLTYFSVHDTKMNGTLPDLHQLVMIKHLDLSKNNFKGILPSYYGANNTHLELLYLSDNVHMTPSPIPTNFVNLNKLRDLSLRNINIIGSIPPFIGTNLTNLVLLDVGSNNVTGSIPSSLANLMKLEYLLLNGNLNLGGNLHQVTNHHPKLKVLLVDGTSLKLPTITCPSLSLNGKGDSPNNTTTYALKVYTDCEVLSNPKCLCCQCCTIGDGRGCSKPLLTSIDGSWLQTFDRKTYVLFIEDEHS